MPRWRKIVIVVVIVLAVLAGTGAWFLQSRYLQQRLAGLAAGQIQKATGLRASFSRFHVSFRTLSADVYGVILRGREPAAGAPLARIPHVFVRLRVASLRPLTVQITELDVDQPRIRIFKMPNGLWNLPPPPVIVSPPAEPVFDLGLRRLRLRQGQLDFAERRIPLDAALDGLRLQLRRAAPYEFTGRFGFAHGVLRGPLPRPVSQSASLRFTLWPNDVRIDDFSWSGNASRLQARGMLHDLAHPRLELQYQASASLPGWRRLVPALAGAAGEVTVTGRAQWSGPAWSAGGRFAAAGLKFTADGASWGPMAAQGAFSADPSGLRMPRVAFTAGGGAGTLNLTWGRWHALAAVVAVHGLALERLLAIAARLPGGPPLVPLAGVAEAHAQVRLDTRAPANWRAAGSAAITPPAQPPRASLPLPLAASLRFAVSPDRWSLGIDHLAIQAPGLSVTAAGAASSAGSALQVAAAVDDLAQWQPVLTRYLPALPGGHGPPLLAGQLRLQAAISGALTTGPVLHVAFSAAKFRYGPFEADQLDAIATVSPETARLGSLIWRLGGQAFHAAGEMSLDRFRATSASTLNFDVSGQDIELARLERWAGAAWPVQGRLSFDFNATGTVGAPRAEGRAQLDHAVLWRQPVPQLTAHLAVTPAGIAAPNFVAVVAGGRIVGAAAYDWKARTYRFQASTAALELAQIVALQSPQLPISGQLSGHLSSEGTLAHPRATAVLDAVNLRGAVESLGTLHVELQADGQTARLHAALGLPNGRLTLAGSFAETSPYGLDADAELTDYDIDVWLRRFTHASITGHSRISGRLHVQGPLLRPADLVLQASFDPLHLSLESVVLQNAGPVRVSMAHGMVSLAQARLVGADTDFSITGQAELQGRQEISGNLNGHVDLAIIHALHPTTHSSGELSLAARVSGTLHKPALTGELQVHDASLAEEDLPVAFDHIEGLLRFTGNRVEIRRLTANTGGGEISITGSAARDPAGFAINLEATGSNLRIRYQGISTTGNLHLRLDGQRGSALLSGDVELTRVGVAPNFDFALFLANRSTSAPAVNSNSFLNRIHLDVRLVTGPQVEVATGAAHLQFQADLRARGTLASPVLLGRASIAEGEIRFAGNEYTINKGDITFANPIRIQPVIDFGLTTTVQQYDITLSISGPVDRLNITYRSDPPLSSRDIVALLATGQTQESQAVNQETSSAFVGQSEQLLSLALDNLLQSRLQRMFGVTQIQFNPASAGLLGTGQATVTVDQQISRNLKVTYTQNLASSSQDIVQVDWTISRHLGITISRDQFGLYGISFHFRHRAR
ncbi:MAG TPA: translocation/assembly module TamB domain-containing protein [Terriglobales bacterium]|nr:translocation/assembly module TamB domain-containing protein [Terriglobales bacterium]